MDSVGPIQRPSIAATRASASSMPQKDSSMASSPGKDHHGYNFKFICPFSIPSTPETTAIRLIKNFLSFGLYYLLFVYIVLFITLIPQRKVSLVYLVGIKEITFLYLLLLRALPKSFVLNEGIYKGFVLFIMCIITSVVLILTGAGIHLLITILSTIPVILIHATLWREDLSFASSEEGNAAAEELVPIMQNKAVADAADESTSLV